MLGSMSHHMPTEHAVAAARRPSDSFIGGRLKRLRISAFRENSFFSRQETSITTPLTNLPPPEANSSPPTVNTLQIVESATAPTDLTQSSHIFDDNSSSTLETTTTNASPGLTTSPLTSPSTNRPDQWTELSLNEKLSCFGSKCPDKRLGKHVWFTEGLLQELYDTKLDGILRRLVRDNHKRIYKGSKSGLNFSTPLLLGTSDDGHDAEPAILLLTEDPNLGEEARRIIQRSFRYQKHTFGIVVLVDCRVIRHPAETDLDNGETAHRPSEKTGFVGINDFFGDVGAIRRRKAFVQRLNQQEGSLWTTMTLGGLLVIQGIYYALSVAHFLFSEPNTDTQMEGDTGAKVKIENENIQPHHPTNGNGFEDGLDSDFCDASSDDGSASLQPEVDETFSSFVSQYLGDFDIYIDCHTTYTEGKKISVTGLDVKASFYPVCLGRLELRDPPMTEALNLSLMSHNSDWCLIPMESSRLHHINTFTLPRGGSVQVDRVNRRQPKSGSKVFVAAGTSGVIETSIIGPSSSYVFPWAERVHKVISIHTTIEPGDSGAWVFDSDGYFYGIAVATVPSLSMTYVLQAEDILQDIAARWTIKASLDTFLPKQASQKSGQNLHMSPAQASQSIMPLRRETAHLTSSRSPFMQSSSRYSTPGSSSSGWSSSTHTSSSSLFSGHSSSRSSVSEYSTPSPLLEHLRRNIVSQRHRYYSSIINDGSSNERSVANRLQPVYEVD